MSVGDQPPSAEDGLAVRAVAGGILLARKPKLKGDSAHSPTTQEAEKYNIPGNDSSVPSSQNSIRALSKGLRSTPQVPNMCMHSRSSTPMLGAIGLETPPETVGAVRFTLL